MIPNCEDMTGFCPENIRIVYPEFAGGSPHKNTSQFSKYVKKAL